jgi:hypothetical protein
MRISGRNGPCCVAKEDYLFMPTFSKVWLPILEAMTEKLGFVFSKSHLPRGLQFEKDMGDGWTLCVYANIIGDKVCFGVTTPEALGCDPLGNRLNLHDFVRGDLPSVSYCRNGFLGGKWSDPIKLANDLSRRFMPFAEKEAKLCWTEAHAKCERLRKAKSLAAAIRSTLGIPARDGGPNEMRMRAYGHGLSFEVRESGTVGITGTVEGFEARHLVGCLALMNEADGQGVADLGFFLETRRGFEAPLRITPEETVIVPGVAPRHTAA